MTRGLSTLRMAMVTCCLLSVGVAHADVATTDPAWWCHGKTQSDQNNLIFNQTTHSLTVASGQTVVSVVCPIAKTTSSPSAGTNDQILAVAMAGVTGAPLPGSCFLNIYTTSITGLGSANLVSTGQLLPQVGINALATTTISPLIQNYWSGLGTSNWLYAQVECVMDGGQAFTNYTTAERGTDNGFRIYPASSCVPSESTDLFDNGVFAGPPPVVGDFGGVDLAPGGTRGRYRCLLPAAVHAQFIFLPTDNGIGFALSDVDGNYPTTAQTNSKGPTQNSFLFPSTLAPAVLPFTPGTGPLLVTGLPSPPTLFLQQLIANGDSAIVSYRTTPN